MSIETTPVQSEDPIRAEVESLLGDVPFRTPIVDDHSTNQVHDARVDHQWLALTEAVRRGIIDDPEVRQVAAGFVSSPLSEELPGRAMSEIATVDERTARLYRLGKALVEMLATEPVPDELLLPDIQNAQPLLRKKYAVDLLKGRKRSGLEEYFRDGLKEIKTQVEESPGISVAEKELVARRYREARDIKLLGLMAELYDQPIEAPQAENGTVSHELSSGVKLVMTDEAFKAAPLLLHPQAWEGRRQLKDRVHIVTVDGKQYIMKERKTSRHTDVKKHGHVDGLTSEQEFNAARDFAELGAVKQNDIELHWEKPLGYVQFPDGYQFCMFEAEPDLTDHPRDQLTREIMESPEEYAKEFDHAQQQAKEIYSNRKDLLWSFQDNLVEKPRWFDFSKSARRRRASYESQPKPDELTFEEFAAIKSYHLIQEAERLLQQTVLSHGYINSDLDGYAFRVHKEGNRSTVEIVGFDFEYYAKRQEDAEIKQQRIQRNDEQGVYGNLMADRSTGKRAIAVAASYGMVEQMGWNLPPER